ncbi:MAG: 3-dehydroquinate synthase [Desulfobacterales bacterium]|nr:3-dehydroquinate synthase [Desulfobacterales bacterium]
MRVLEIKGKTGRSKICVGEKLINLPQYLPETKTVIITNEDVARHYQQDFPPVEVIIVGAGEGFKTLDTAARIYDRLISMEADRSAFLVGIGGGIICDLTGFVASTYLRGVRFGYVPTSLLAQVDASVGGKTGVNFSGYKNMVGVFSQPEFVICDPQTLMSLPPEEHANGFAEIVKHAAIADSGYFEYLEKETGSGIELSLDVLEKIIYESVSIKASIVNRDETEKGERRKLNFGHTFGHAVEKTTGIPHGKAVSIGMVVAAELSAARGMISGKDVDRISNLLSRFNLPTKMEGNKDTVLDALAKDKKREGDHIHFVLLQSIGKAVIEPISLAELEEILK